MLLSDMGFKPEFEIDDAAIAPASVQLKASDKGAGKTFRERIKKGLMPEVLDVLDIEDDVKQRSATIRGKASPTLPIRSPGVKSPGPASAGLASGLASGMASGFATSKDRMSMVFAETPMWFGEGPLGPFGESMPSLDSLREYAEKHADEAQSTKDSSTRSTTESHASADSRGRARKKQDDAWGAEIPPEKMPTMPQIQYVPVPTPAPGGWNGQEQLGAYPQSGPMMIPVPVPVPVPMNAGMQNADAQSAALSASIAAAGYQDLYSAFLSQYQCAPPPQPQQVKPPPGFVPPPGYKLVPAPEQNMPAMPAMPAYPGSWPSVNMNHMNSNMDYDIPRGRENPHSIPDTHMVKRPASSTSKSNGKGSGKVFIGGLSPSTTADMLRNHFSRFGKLVDVSVIKDSVTKLSRGFGFVEFDGGVPPKLLEIEHVIDQRKCGVKRYTYEAA